MANNDVLLIADNVVDISNGDEGGGGGPTSADDDEEEEEDVYSLVCTCIKIQSGVSRKAQFVYYYHTNVICNG